MEPSQELREIISGWFEAVVKGDASWRDKYVSKDAKLRFIGTDPGEWLSGKEAYDFLKHEAENVGGKVQIVVNEVEAFTEGTVGWGVALPTITLPGGKQVSPRWGAVFHQEDGQWKIVQLHASIGISNEAAFGALFS